MCCGAVAAGGEVFAVMSTRMGGTGISATDRAHTIRLLADPALSAGDLAWPDT
ncbi:hypothetical protein ACFWNN_45145 [Lentzea sp. NPDC058450]|uniref:hypothetical protein n=1 Tax=Lentzea sp. NPDC058450 TaxID=3346505 RepID=UPI003668C7D0